MVDSALILREEFDDYRVITTFEFGPGVYWTRAIDKSGNVIYRSYEPNEDDARIRHTQVVNCLKKWAECIQKIYEVAQKFNKELVGVAEEHKVVTIVLKNKLYNFA
ncbi:MAG TPA: hypothetical protein VGK47_09350 [Nitrososphaeraceae archaeon]